jgi:hypothetical protein
MTMQPADSTGQDLCMKDTGQTWNNASSSSSSSTMDAAVMLSLKGEDKGSLMVCLQLILQLLRPESGKQQVYLAWGLSTT